MSQQVQLLRTEVFMRRGKGSGKGGRKFYPLVLLFRNVPIGNDGAGPLPDYDLFSS